MRPVGRGVAGFRFFAVIRRTTPRERIKKTTKVRLARILTRVIENLHVL
jgi:hypothetical protein